MACALTHTPVGSLYLNIAILVSEFCHARMGLRGLGFPPEEKSLPAAGMWRTLVPRDLILSKKIGCPILPRSVRKGGLSRISTAGSGVKFFRHGEACALPAIRLFSFSDLQLLSQAGADDAGGSL